MYLQQGILRFLDRKHRPFEGMAHHELACNMLQRMCAQLANNKEIEVQLYPEEDIRVCNNITFELDLIRKNTSGKVFLCLSLYGSRLILIVTN